MDHGKGWSVFYHRCWAYSLKAITERNRCVSNSHKKYCKMTSSSAQPIILPEVFQSMQMVLELMRFKYVEEAVIKSI
jgi:hypothetical protein